MEMRNGPIYNILVLVIFVVYFYFSLYNYELFLVMFSFSRSEGKRLPYLTNLRIRGRIILKLIKELRCIGVD
jgi:hypothetical protein